MTVYSRSDSQVLESVLILHINVQFRERERERAKGYCLEDWIDLVSLMYTHSLVTHLRTRSTVDNIATPKRVEVESRIYETNRVLVNCFNSCKGIKTHQINTFQTMTSNTVTDKQTDGHTDRKTDERVDSYTSPTTNTRKERNTRTTTSKLYF